MRWFLGGIVCLFSMAAMVVLWWNWPPTFGLDLTGGVYLRYAVLLDDDTEEVDIRNVVSNVIQCIDFPPVIVQPAGERSIAVMIPGVVSIDDEIVPFVRNRIERGGTFELRIVANRRDHLPIVSRAESTFPNPVLSENGEILARWLPIVPNVFPSESETSYSDAGDEIVFHETEDGKRWLLLVQDPYNVSGKYLRRAATEWDENGSRMITFGMNAEGAKRLRALSGENLPEPDGFTRHLAICLNGEIYSDPYLKNVIGERGAITGRFNFRDADKIAMLLRAGSLPKLELSESHVRTPVVPGTSLAAIKLTAFLATVLVFVFVIAYYHHDGFAAVGASFFHLLFLAAALELLGGAYSLPITIAFLLAFATGVGVNLLFATSIRGQSRVYPPVPNTTFTGFRRAAIPALVVYTIVFLAGVTLYIVGGRQTGNFSPFFSPFSTSGIKDFGITLSLGALLGTITSFLCQPVLLSRFFAASDHDPAEPIDAEIIT